MECLSCNLTYSIRCFVFVLGFIAFTLQLGSRIENYIFPTITNTNLIEKNLKDICFPLVIKICLKPGFDETAIKEAGYFDIFGFFKGQSTYNRYGHPEPDPVALYS